MRGTAFSWVAVLAMAPMLSQSRTSSKGTYEHCLPCTQAISPIQCGTRGFTSEVRRGTSVRRERGGDEEGSGESGARDRVLAQEDIGSTAADRGVVLEILWNDAWPRVARVWRLARLYRLRE